MNRDEAKKILGENATEEQITNFLNDYHLNENAKVKELQDQLDALKSENSKYSGKNSTSRLIAIQNPQKRDPLAS